MSAALLAWVGNTDLRAAQSDDEPGIGPIAQALSTRQFDDVYLLSNFAADVTGHYKKWLAEQTTTSIAVEPVVLDSPTNFGAIHQAVVGVVENICRQSSLPPELTFHLTPGTPAMAAVWILLSKTRFPAELIESSKQHGVATVSAPFDVSAEYLPSMFRRLDERLTALSAGLAPESPEFDAIIHKSAQMKRVIAMARRVAPRRLPVLIEGENGTGKELLARAIHKASPRAAGSFVAVNCGAIPKELFEAEFFGHQKGAFTGASIARPGHFEQANGGTLFLDEIGELPLCDQVKLLRVLQEGEVTRLGSSKAKAVDVRVVSAMNRDLLAAVADSSFREDLYYRLAVAVVFIPPIREREGDLSLLIDKSLEKVNDESQGEPGYEDRKLSAGAKNLMLQYRWPGNVRELLNVIRRAAMWSSTATITKSDMTEALSIGRMTRDEVELGLIRPVEQGVDLPALLERVKRHYLEGALSETRGNKQRAAKLLGLRNYQTLTNWMNSCGLKMPLAHSVLKERRDPSP